MHVDRRILQRAVFRLGDARTGDRVRAQKLWHAIRPKLRATEHRVEEGRHRVRIESSVRQHADADAVGFVLVFARESDLRLRSESLRCADRAHRCVGAGAADSAEQDRRQYRGRRYQARARLRLDAARNVPLRDVRDFVRQHARELAFILCFEQEPRVDADITAGQCERIDRGVANHEEVEIVVAFLREARQP